MKSHRLDPNRVRTGTLEIIEHIDSEPLSEPEKLAVLLSATYAQRQSMVEAGGFTADIARVESVHRDTIDALNDNGGAANGNGG